MSYNVEVKDFHPETLAQAFIKYRGPFLGGKGELIFQYQPKTGHWKLLGFEDIAVQVQGLSSLGWYSQRTDYDGSVAKVLLRQTPRQVDAVVRTILRTPLPEFVPSFGISCLNGFIGPNGIRHNKPENMSGRFIDLTWNPDAKCPKFEKMLAQIMGNDLPEWATAKIRILQKFIGAALFGMAPQYAKFLILIGRGANGKTTFQEVIEEILFKGRNGSVSPKFWNKEYNIASLFNVDLNVVSELPEVGAFTSEQFKAVITGDAIQGRHVRERPFTFRPTAGHIFAANELPLGGDISEGFWRRAIVMPFTQDFRKLSGATKEDVKGPIIKEERQGVFNWAIEGAKAVIREGGYQLGDWHDAGINDWKRDADPILGFLEETTERGGNATAHSIYENYKYWCWLQGITPINSIAFGRRMTQHQVGKNKVGGVTYYDLKEKPRPDWVIVRTRNLKQGKDIGGN